MLKKGDIILVLLIVFGISLIVISGKGNNTESLSSWDNVKNQEKQDVYAIIKKDDKIIQKVNLSSLEEREVIKISGLYNEIIVADQKKICFMSAECPDRLCIKSRWLSKPGQIAVCLPNRTLIKLVQGNNSME